MDMVTPSINKLLTKVDSRYTLVVLASKRARQILTEKNDIKVKVKSKKNVTIALAEVAEDKITYARTKLSIK